MVNISEYRAGDSCADLVHSSGDGVDTLHDLMAQATSMYALKNYDAAAELYSRAMEIQAEQNGEMSPQNADLLYAYGRCLYHVAVSNSDVLGSKAPGDKPIEALRKPKRKWEEMDRDGDRPREKITDDIIADVVTENRGMQIGGADVVVDSKPYFQFIGDENSDESEDSEEDGAEDGGEADAGDQEDDFVNAYEVLDLARVLLLRRLDDLEASNGKGNATEDSETVKQLKERLADTHDLQAEISLEGERFRNAVLDLRAALALKQELFPQDSSLIAEAHYKLALALEFSSVKQPKDDIEGDAISKETLTGEATREEAVKEMKAAIASCRLRIQREEAVLQAESGSNESGDKVQISREGIDDVNEMVKDMEQRVRRVHFITSQDTDRLSVDRATATSCLFERPTRGRIHR